MWADVCDTFWPQVTSDDTSGVVEAKIGLYGDAKFGILCGSLWPIKP